MGATMYRCLSVYDCEKNKVVKCFEQSSYISSLLVPIFRSPEAKAQVELLWSVIVRRITFSLNDI